jgi:hypothetical protein
MARSAYTGSGRRSGRSLSPLLIGGNEPGLERAIGVGTAKDAKKNRKNAKLS